MKVLIWIFLLVAGISADYCSPDLCGNKKHIGCGNKGQFSLSCPASANILDIKSYIKLILDEHNKYRNVVAGNNLPGFEPAVRMRALTWNTELANLAELNVRQCKMKHDSCHNTLEFKYSGQNLASYGTTGKLEPTARITGMIKSWFDEYKLASMKDIKKFEHTSGIGHFTAMITDRSTEIGCAVVEYTENEWKKILLACNYASTNILEASIYKSGPTASNCTTGRSKEYTSLCSEREPINPNEI